MRSTWHNSIFQEGVLDYVVFPVFLFTNYLIGTQDSTFHSPHPFLSTIQNPTPNEVRKAILLFFF